MIEQVSCKVLNVRSGAELPEKCRELALHFESQGTPIMIGQLFVFLLFGMYLQLSLIMIITRNLQIYCSTDVHILNNNVYNSSE